MNAIHLANQHLRIVPGEWVKAGFALGLYQSWSLPWSLTSKDQETNQQEIKSSPSIYPEGLNLSACPLEEKGIIRYGKKSHGFTLP